jgi:hypothetical protein
VIGDALGTLLQASTDNSGLTIDLANDKDRANDAGGQALEDDCLVVVNGYLRTVVGEGYSIRRRGGIIRLGGRGRRAIQATARFVDVNDVHHERICKRLEFEPY